MLRAKERERGSQGGGGGEGRVKGMRKSKYLLKEYE